MNMDMISANKRSYSSQLGETIFKNAMPWQDLRWGKTFKQKGVRRVQEEAKTDKDQEGRKQRLAKTSAEVNQEGSEGLRKVEWEPKAVRKEEKEETGQGHLEVLMSSERMGGGGNLHNELRKKAVKIFPVAFKLIHMHDSYGLYGMWYMETQLFLVYSIKECSVEYSQASYRTDSMTKVREFL